MSSNIEAAKARLEAMRARMRQQDSGAVDAPNDEVALPVKRKVAQDHKLPPASSDSRIVPNAFLRSALFGAVGKEDKLNRYYLEDVPSPSLKNYKFSVVGHQTDQKDLDVYLAILHEARNVPIGQPVQISSYSLLNAIGLTDTGPNMRALAARLARLRSITINFEDRNAAGQTGNRIVGLIDFAERPAGSKKWSIKISESSAFLFGKNQYTKLNWAIRRDLGGRSMAKWMHGFYSSHNDNPFEYSVGKLQEYYGSEIDPRKFKHTLKCELEFVAEVSTKHKTEFKFEIVGDIVRVKKNDRPAEKKEPNIKY